jgi:hypothetical protein
VALDDSFLSGLNVDPVLLCCQLYDVEKTKNDGFGLVKEDHRMLQKWHFKCHFLHNQHISHVDPTIVTTITLPAWESHHAKVAAILVER